MDSYTTPTTIRTDTFMVYNHQHPKPNTFVWKYYTVTDCYEITKHYIDRYMYRCWKRQKTHKKKLKTVERRRIVYGWHWPQVYYDPITDINIFIRQKSSPTKCTYRILRIPHRYWYTSWSMDIPFSSVRAERMLWQW